MNKNKIVWWNTRKRIFDKFIFYSGLFVVLLTAIAFGMLEGFKAGLFSICYSLFFYVLYYSFTYFIVQIIEFIDRTFKIKTLNKNILYFNLYCFLICLISLLYPVFFYQIAHLYF